MLATTLAADGGAALEVLPQGTILFDGARLSRRTRLYCDAGSIMLYGEILHLGRGAMGERFRRGSLIDRTEIICDGRLLFLDALRLDEATMAAMTALSGLGGADTVAVLYLLSQAGDRHLDRKGLGGEIVDPNPRQNYEPAVRDRKIQPPVAVRLAPSDPRIAGGQRLRRRLEQQAAEAASFAVENEPAQVRAERTGAAEPVVPVNQFIPLGDLPRLRRQVQ